MSTSERERKASKGSTLCSTFSTRIKIKEMPNHTTTAPLKSKPSLRAAFSHNQSTNSELLPLLELFCEAMKRLCRNLRLVSIFLPSFTPFFRSSDGSGGLGILSTI